MLNGARNNEAFWIRIMFPMEQNFPTLPELLLVLALLFFIEVLHKLMRTWVRENVGIYRNRYLARLICSQCGHQMQLAAGCWLSLERTLCSAWQSLLSVSLTRFRSITSAPFRFAIEGSDRPGRIFFGRTFDLVSGQQCICACVVPHPLCT